MNYLRIAAIVLTGVGPSFAHEGKKNVLAAVRELSLPTMSGFPRGKVSQPLEITSAELLARTFEDEKQRSEIASNVDFASQKLVYFAWSGSGQDRLMPVATEKEAAMVFQFQRGLTKDIRAHRHLFVMPREMTWSVVTVK